jgi:hypothetical protein
MKEWEETLRWLLFVSILVGPGVFTIWRQGGDLQKPERPKRVTPESSMMALMWTTAMLGLVMGWHSHRGKALKEVCNAFETDLDQRNLGDRRLDEIKDMDWWDACHPEDAPEPDPND